MFVEETIAGLSCNNLEKANNLWNRLKHTKLSNICKSINANGLKMFNRTGFYNINTSIQNLKTK